MEVYSCFCFKANISVIVVEGEVSAVIVVVAG